MSPLFRQLSDSDGMLTEEKRKAWLWARLVTGAARSGLGVGGKAILHPFCPRNINDFQAPQSGPFPEQAQVRLCLRTLPQPNPRGQCK